VKFIIKIGKTPRLLNGAFSLFEGFEEGPFIKKALSGKKSAALFCLSAFL